MKRLIVLLLVLAVLSLYGCSGSANNSEASTSAASQAAQESAASAQGETPAEAASSETSEETSSGAGEDVSSETVESPRTPYELLTTYTTASGDVKERKIFETETKFFSLDFDWDSMEKKEDDIVLFPGETSGIILPIFDNPIPENIVITANPSSGSVIIDPAEIDNDTTVCESGSFVRLALKDEAMQIATFRFYDKESYSVKDVLKNGEYALTFMEGDINNVLGLTADHRDDEAMFKEIIEKFGRPDAILVDKAFSSDTILYADFFWVRDGYVFDLDVLDDSKSEGDHMSLTPFMVTTNVFATYMDKNTDSQTAIYKSWNPAG